MAFTEAAEFARSIQIQEEPSSTADTSAQPLEVESTSHMGIDEDDDLGGSVSVVVSHLFPRR